MVTGPDCAIIAAMSSVITPAGRRERRSVDSEVSGDTAHRATHRATYLLVLFLLSLFAWAPLLYPGYLQVHSGFLPVFNLADLAASPNKLRWLPTIGVTPDLLRGEGPFAYWLALLLRPFAGDVGAVKGVFAFSILAGGLGVAAWTRRAFARWDEHDIVERSAVLAAMVFMLWPPLLATVYVRGALAEAVLMALVPWALWGVTGVRCQVSSIKYQVAGGGAYQGSNRRQVFSLIGVGFLALALVWTQAGLALWATAVLVAWALWPGAPGRSRLTAAGAVLAGAAIGFGLLLILHGNAATGAGLQVDIAAHAVYPYQLFSPAWSFGISTPDWKGDLPLQLGLAALALAMVTVILGAGSLDAREEQSAGSTPAKPLQSALGFSLVVGLILVLLTTTVARPLWRMLPALASTLTYPWQLFALIGPLLAFLAGAVLVVERRLALLPMWAGLVVFVVLSSTAYLSPRFTQVAPSPAPASIFGSNQITLLTAGATFFNKQAPSAGSPYTLQPATSASDLQPAASPSDLQRATLQPATPLTVTLAWQALQPIAFDYNLFVHAVDEAGNKLAQWDGQPQRDQDPYPMTQWQVGEIVPGTIRLELTPEQAAAVRQVVIGVYNWQSGSRLPVGSDDKVIIPVHSAPLRDFVPPAPNSEVAP